MLKCIDCLSYVLGKRYAGESSIVDSCMSHITFQVDWN